MSRYFCKCENAKMQLCILREKYKKLEKRLCERRLCIYFLIIFDNIDFAKYMTTTSLSIIRLREIDEKRIFLFVMFF